MSSSWFTVFWLSQYQGHQIFLSKIGLEDQWLSKNLIFLENEKGRFFPENFAERVVISFNPRDVK